jgi:hydrogenase maturation protease
MYPVGESIEPADWKESLGRRLKGSVVIVGVGNPLRGDDAVGTEVARRLQGSGSFTVLCCEAAPENFLGPIIKAHPDVILLIDAADLGAAPGTIRLLGSTEFPQSSFSTHNMSPAGFLGFLKTQLPKVECLLLLVQPASCGFGEGLSPAAEQAAGEIAAALRELARASPA